MGAIRPLDMVSETGVCANSPDGGGERVQGGPPHRDQMQPEFLLPGTHTDHRPAGVTVLACLLVEMAEQPGTLT